MRRSPPSARKDCGGLKALRARRPCARGDSNERGLWGNTELAPEGVADAVVREKGGVRGRRLVEVVQARAGRGEPDFASVPRARSRWGTRDPARGRGAGAAGEIEGMKPSRSQAELQGHDRGLILKSLEVEQGRRWSRRCGVANRHGCRINSRKGRVRRPRGVAPRGGRGRRSPSQTGIEAHPHGGM